MYVYVYIYIQNTLNLVLLYGYDCCSSQWPILAQLISRAIL